VNQYPTGLLHLRIWQGISAMKGMAIAEKIASMECGVAGNVLRQPAQTSLCETTLARFGCDI
jgi:hypothetical protein